MKMFTKKDVEACFYKKNGLRECDPDACMRFVSANEQVLIDFAYVLDQNIKLGTEIRRMEKSLNVEQS